MSRSRLPQYSTKEYLEFIRGTRKTAHGKSFEEIMNYSDRQLEMDHAYIQWIFPLTTASMFNLDAPIINLEELFQSNEAKEAILRSANKLTAFWGIPDGGAVDTDRLTSLNGHNGLRFSRYLQSMVYHGHVDVAQRSLDTVKANLSLLSPTMGRSGKTLWEELFLEAKGQMKEVNKVGRDSK